jgi:hypothetical protein
MSVAFQKVNVRCFQGHGNTIVFDREMFGVQFLKDGIHCRSEQRLIQRFDKVAECNAISLHSVLMPLRDKYHQGMFLHLDQRLCQLKTVGWHLDIEKKQIKGFLLHLQFAQKFVSIHVSFNVKAALHIVLLDALNNAIKV